jgi:predicted nucleic acid-binding protein
VSHLLDTNAFVDHLRRGPASRVTGKLLAAPPGTVYLCTVVLAELVYGAVWTGLGGGR